MLYTGNNASLRRLSIAMVIIGFSFFVSPLIANHVAPSLFRWTTPMLHAADERMLIAIYIALGICLILAAKDPLHNAILIDFTIISSLLHGGVMLYDAIDMYETERMHLLGDVPMMFVLAIGFLIFHPKRLARSGA